MGCTGEFTLADGRAVAFSATHGDSYEEKILAGRHASDLTRPSLRARVAHRLGREPQRDVLGIARMLRLWERRLRGESIPGLPAFDTVLTELRVRDSLAASEPAATT